MGVLGLWEILESVGHPIKVEGLEGKVLGVDANIWLYKFIRGFREKDNATNIESHKLGLFNRISKLLFYRIKPVFVFDGPAPVLKRRTLERRQNIRNKTLSKVQDAAMKAIANQLKSQYPGADIDHLRITLPDLRSNNLVAAEKLGDEDFNLFYLPPEAAKEEGEKDEETDSDSDYEYGSTIPNSDRVDVESKDFKELPPEVRYEILQDIKAKRRRIRNVVLPDDANSFSNLQLQRLKARRGIQQKIEECEKEICTNYTGELADGKTIQAFRVQSNAMSTILYSNNQQQVQNYGAKVEMDDIKHKVAEAEEIRDVFKPKPVLIKVPSTHASSVKATEVRKTEDLPMPKLNLSPKPSTSTSDNPFMVEIDFEAPDDNEPYEKFVGLSKENDSKPNMSDDEMDSSNTSHHFMQKERNERELMPEARRNEASASTSDGAASSSSPAKKTTSEFKRNADIAAPDQAVEVKTTPATIESVDLTHEQDPRQQIEVDLREHEHELFEGNAVSSPKPGAASPKRASADSSDSTILILDSPTGSSPPATKRSTRTSTGAGLSDNTILILDSPTSSSPPAAEQSTQTSTSSFVSQRQRIDGAKLMFEAQEEFETIKHIDKKSRTNDLLDESPRRERPKSPASIPSQAQQAPPATQRQIFRSEDHSEHIANAQRATNKVTGKIIEDAKELLRLFGIPYMDAAGEAEAQCAKLEELKLTMGTITDDSDIWLFGSQNVYRYFFSDDKYVMQYKMPDIEYHIRMTRENLVCFAMLVGSDYTDGIVNVGPVTALEILSEFPGEGLEPLEKFNDWHRSALGDKKLIGDRKRKKLLKYNIPNEFPSRSVYDGYMKPVADSTDEQFTWGTPELDELREYARRNFGWDQKKSDEKLLPVMKKLNEKIQKTIDTFFFKTQANRNPEMFRSKRVNQALNKIAKRVAVEPEVVNLSDDDEDEAAN